MILEEDTWYTVSFSLKAKAISASVLGTKVAFFSYVRLPDGRAASELVTPELPSAFPLRLKEVG